jgi:alkanesulfonate monooxygenase SsuD/methylene tetrahydromethanopterin reductase-like flavin-dependent oxidoreductase (luciferase family)
MSEVIRQPALGFALRDPYPWHDLAELAAAGEAGGFTALFLPEVGTRDTLVTLAALAGETDRLTLATGVVPLASRSPALLASAAATVQERSGGRFVLGLGTGPSRPGALGRLRATVQALRAAFSGGTGQVDHETVRCALPLPFPPEIWVAALGPRATRLAGEVADGVLLNWCTPERVAAAVEQVAAGAAAAGRNPSDITIAVYVRAALTAGSAAAARTAAAEYASYPAYRAQFVTMGIDPDDAAAVVAGVMLDDPATARERVGVYRAAGADLPVVYPVVPAGRPSADAALETLRAAAPGTR